MKVISFKSLPARLPIEFTWITILTLDFYDCSDATRYVAYGFLFVIWVICVSLKINEETIEVFNEVKK